jgi:RNA polymerase subunit RPABC4/transcription elongation factor Spt4
VNRSREDPPATGGWEPRPRRPNRGTLAALFLAALVVGSALLAFSFGAPGAAAPARAPAAETPVAPAITTHGDLIVPFGVTRTIEPTPGNSTYFQGGNITVENGGKLYIRNTTLSFVQYVSPTGTAAQRLSHLYQFNVQAGGIVDVYNSTITTDALLVNAYVKLNLTVNGTMAVYGSQFEFPGWVNVGGASASLTLNGSSVTQNPQVGVLGEPTVLLGDLEFAPTLSAVSGGQINLFNTTVNDVYADNLTLNGTPRPAPLTKRLPTGLAAGDNETGLATPNDTANLSLDWLYPMGILGGQVVVAYNDTNAVATNVTVQVNYGGNGYALPGTLNFKNGTSGGFATIAFSAALTHAINKAGMLAYLNNTGDFGVVPAKAISIVFPAGGWTGLPVNASALALQLNPVLSNDISASGTGSRISTVDSRLDLTFGNVPTSPVSLTAPLPWLANKLSLTDNATAYLGNLSTPNPIGIVFGTSAIVTDATSSAILFRWAGFNLTGLGGVLAVSGGKVAAYYAYNNTQANNATANTANALKTSDPAIWDYLQYWDQVHLAPSYGVSNPYGLAELLLASNEITGSSLPDGLFLGTYHVGITIDTPTDNATAFNWSVSAYPSGVAYGTPNWELPDFGPQVNFPSYYASLAVPTINVLANGTVSPNATVRYGQVLGIELTLKNTGTAPVTTVEADLYYDLNETPKNLLDSVNLSVDLTPANPETTVDVTWTVNDGLTGDHGQLDTEELVVLTWNNNSVKLGGGLSDLAVPVTLLPSIVTLKGVTSTAPTTLSLTGDYQTIGTILYNGSNAAGIEILATPTSGGPTIVLSGASFYPGGFSLNWGNLASRLSAGTSYRVQIVGSYNDYRAYYNYSTPFVVPPTSPHAKNFLTEKLLGLPIWVWIAIAAAIVAGVLLFLLFARRGAAGKLVECGECGNLIPESATVCPKCGAEFENDLVRCSRCASTIPASSKFCPECAAQLLGKPGEEALDPERQGYADFTERFRAEAKKELGDNYNEGSFWDWWKRQPSYVSFSQWKLQQGQGTGRTGMGAPPPGGRPPATPPPAPARRPPTAPPRPGGGAAGKAPPSAAPAASAAPGDRMGASTSAATDAAPAAGGAAAAALKPCPNCGKEIPPEYLVCPFCGSVTQ